jgi:hypothetical protein
MKIVRKDYEVVCEAPLSIQINLGRSVFINTGAHFPTTQTRRTAQITVLLTAFQQGCN